MAETTVQQAAAIIDALDDAAARLEVLFRRMCLHLFAQIRS